MPQPTASIPEPVVVHASSQATRRRATPNRSKRAGHTVVAVVGLGYVGLPTAIALRGAGCRIVGIDVSGPRLSAIRNGEAELLESEQRDLRHHLASDGFVLTNRIKALDAADLVLICVPTPVDEQLRPDPRILRQACASVVRHARPGQTLVLTSTTYVGTTRELLADPLAERGLRVGEDVFVAFAPERIDPGVSDHEQLKTPRVLGGVTEECTTRAASVLRHTCKRLHRVSSPEAAELVKLHENTFRAVNIALAFELADACETHGLDPIEVIEGAATKPYGFHAALPLRRGGGALHRGRSPLPAARPARARAPREDGRGGAAQARRPPPARGMACARSAGGAGAPPARGARAGRRHLLQARRRRHARVAGPGDRRPPARRGRARRLPRPARAGARGRRWAPARSRIRRSPRSYDLAILTTLHPDHDYEWLERAPAVLDCTYRRRDAGLMRFTP